ncbi:lipase member H-like [Amyelois transitella]|uniref:lipase member H-like n=1 Tax=Amyelois transitella TaxID=680683 RepID=UPI00298FB523|nr:lipase member H-like [Amyelois transitella]
MRAVLVSCEDDYGESWLYFIDEKNGTTHVMNFSLPVDNRGFILGQAYFYLYTRQNMDEAEELILPKNGSITSKYFNESNDIKAVTHGWLSDSKTDWMQGIRRRFLDTSDCNVILVDWGELADNPIYPWSALCTRYVGRQLSKILGSLGESYAIQDRHIHLAGHSLGAHVMGYAGMFSGGRVNRITGLDPARPLFEFPDVGPGFRLDETDAAFVDIIHSCCGTLGYKHSHGHADFYPNGGSSPQPGCEGTDLAALRSDPCSHGRSYEFFSESIFPTTKFRAYPCDNWKAYENGRCSNGEVYMGVPANISDEGNFYLRTNNESLYAI